MQQLVVIGLANTGDKQVGIIAGGADHAKDTTGFNIDGYQGAALIVKCLVGDFLQLAIQMHGEIRARQWTDIFQNAHNPAPSISFHMLGTHSTQQSIFIIFLQTNFANTVGAAVGH